MKSLLLRSQNLPELKAEFFQRLERFDPSDRQEIQRALDWAEELHINQKRASGEPYIIHPIQVAGILAELNLDSRAVIAGLLHDILEDTSVSPDQMRQAFGQEVLDLVDGVTKIHILHAKSKSDQEAATIRKMFFAMIQDIRVILIKLADKVHNMFTLQHLPEHKIKRIAAECLDIYAPLAGKLGISNVKNQLEDLALKHLDREAYYQIKEFITAKREERDAYLTQVKKALMDAAKAEGLAVDVDARAKHFYSIYTKWKKKSRDLGEVFDMLGIRVYCQTTTECYTMLGVVHRIWKPIEGRFKDYIAMPKDNGYQSLHTTVMGYGGQLTEIQIRTWEMHRTAEYGVAAHWLYKQGGSVDPREFSIVNRLKNWQNEALHSDNFLDEIKTEILKDGIFVFTPKGQVIELPGGSTALDFAYSIHTEVGHHTFAAKADGQIIPLHQELKNTQVIEIITQNNAHPHINWLRSAKTHRARSKIRHWLAHNDPSLIISQNIVAKKKDPVEEKKLKPLPAQVDDLGPLETQRVQDPKKVGISLDGEKNLLIRFAQCCSPVTGDEILGFVSRGRGIIIHRSDCPNLKGIPQMDQRRVEVEWETVSSRVTQRFKVVAKRGADLFSEIESAVRKHKGHLIEGRLDDDHAGHLFGTFTMELEGREDLQKVLKAVRSMPSVKSIQKMDN